MTAPSSPARPDEDVIGKAETGRPDLQSPNGALQAKAEDAKPRPRLKSEIKLNLWEKALYWLMLGTLHALSLIPDFVLYPLGVLGGYLGFLLDRRHIEIGMKNLEIAFPDKAIAERRSILRASYINLGRSAAEYIRLAGFFYRRLKKRVTYERFWYWEEFKRKYPSRGLLVVTAHYGNFELLPAAHAMYGYQIALVHHTQRFLPGDAMLSFVRDRVGVECMRKHNAARAVLRALRAGEIVGIPFDQNAKRSEAVFVPFFGEPASTTGGLARIAVLSGAGVVPVFIVRQPDGRHHRIEIGDEIPLANTGDVDADVAENTRRFVKAVEDAVRRHPEQFLWTHRRYRTRPRGMPPVYANQRPKRSL
ncbi:MAG TPA: lysophospholipid acyltransferase family protein [Candidatus Binataceae bacterium]|nr:lysophospholipid acyltransferase family protein [Candidatus Binataceae bacterium]